MPHVAARARARRIENDALEVNIPDAEILLAPDRTVPLKGGLFTAAEILGTRLSARSAHFADVARLAAGADRRSPLTLFEELPRDSVDGNLDREDQSQPAAAGRRGDERHQGGSTGRHQRRRAKKVVGPYSVQGASININVTEKAADATCEMLINGVLAKVGWQRIFDAPLDMHRRCA